MGAWDESIMGGDTPMDIECEFEDEFPNGKIPMPDEVCAFIEKTMETYSDEPLVKVVAGFLVIGMAAPFNDRLRSMVLDGIIEELKGINVWNHPEKRKAVLDDFHAIVVAYPDDGAKVELPYQMGLLEKIAQIFPD